MEAQGLSDLQVVNDARTRKHPMLFRSREVLALLGGSGTLEELLQALDTHIGKLPLSLRSRRPSQIHRLRIAEWLDFAREESVVLVPW